MMIILLFLDASALYGTSIGVCINMKHENKRNGAAKKQRKRNYEILRNKQE